MPLSAVRRDLTTCCGGRGVVTGGGGGLGGRACVGKKGAGSAKGRQCESTSTQEQQSPQCLGSTWALCWGQRSVATDLNFLIMCLCL